MRIIIMGVIFLRRMVTSRCRRALAYGGVEYERRLEEPRVDGVFPDESSSSAVNQDDYDVDEDVDYGASVGTRRADV